MAAPTLEELRRMSASELQATASRMLDELERDNPGSVVVCPGCGERRVADNLLCWTCGAGAGR